MSWNQDGLNKPLFVSLTNLLSMRNGGQLEAHDTCSDDATSDAGETSSSAATTHPATLSSPELKTRFLDRLAEVVSCKKGPTHVACAVMKEENTHVTIWVARNEGFVEADVTFLKTFQELMSKIEG
jgi:hypothetical protein